MSCLEGMGLSETQRAAVLDGRSQVLVAAGAGSGKTRLLVAYFLRALVDEGIPAERLIAVTFTRKAAAELLGRLRMSLEGCGRPDLARSLDASTVGTIHSLCRRLIKERALEAGVDPACTVLEAETAALVKEDVSREAWDAVVEKADEVQLEVLASRGEPLRREIVPLYDRLRGMGWEEPRVVIPSDSTEEDERRVLMESVREALAAAGTVDRPGASLQSDVGRLQECLAWLGRPNSLKERAAGLAATGAFFPSKLTRSVEPHFEPVRVAMTRYRRALAEVCLEPQVTTMNGLLAEFHQRYEARKRERGLLDFADLELRARALVAGGSAGRPPTLASGGPWVLVDEFQDTNELQCSILEGLGAARLLMVGDENQSIYRFRGADVAVFTKREAALTSGAGGGSTGGLHRLSTNYRSRREILNFINRLFSSESFFGRRYVPLGHPEPEDAMSLSGAALAPPVEVLLASRLQRDDSDAPAQLMQEAEAGVVADRIRRLIDEEGRLQNDIVVLLSAQTHVDLYQQALVDRGLQVYVVGGRGYYSQEEVADVASLLRLLVNPHDDLALVGALRSPLVGISDDGLYLLGQQGRRERTSLWEVIRAERFGALPGEDRRLLAAFVERLAALKRRVGRPGLARLIDDAVSACGYDVCLLAATGGKRRFANVRKLMRMASEFEALEGPDLAGFVDLLESMGELVNREGSAPTLAEGEDVVRVMTVHQAKGLEFPVVVLAGLGSDVPRGSTPEFVVGNDGRMGVFLKGSQRKTYECDDLCLGPAAEIVADERRREREEDLRLLYVAMTRAEERLILVGAGPKDGDLEKCRVGRIVAALGLDARPLEGEMVGVDGLQAVVATVTPAAWEAEAGSPRQAFTPISSSEGEGVGPQFLEAAQVCSGLRQVSFSDLGAYERCPCQFYLQRILGLSSDLTPINGGLDHEDGSSAGEEPVLDADERSAGLEVGLLVHAVLERLPDEERPPEGELLRRSALEWLAETGTRLSPDQVERALALTRAFWLSPVAGLRSSPAATREMPFFYAQGDTLISGIMDLLCREEGLWRIVDYKTNALRERPPAEVAANYRLQTVMYCLAALRAGAPAVRMDFVFLEAPENPVTVSYGLEDVPRLESILDEALAGLRNARFPSLAGEGCESCSVADICVGMSASVSSLLGDGIQ